MSSNNKIRLPPERRRHMIWTAAVQLSKTVGLLGWTRKDVAAACAVTTSDETVKHYFKSQDEFRKLIAQSDEADEQIKSDAKSVGLI